MSIDAITRRWIRNVADERAAGRGYRFDPTRGTNDEGTGIIDFIQSNLRLYEGEGAGKLVVLMPWQIDVLMRIFGWVKFDSEWGRDVRRFRKASLWLPKKNGKSPLAAMVGLYLLVGDGEQGQKVFSAAKDGGQAAIMHTHARMMVDRSPALKDECKINQSTGRIIHLPTSSFYDVLSGDNIAGQEGINGSIIIDEVHVVDDRLARVIEYAGASRSEALQLEVSTAGDNPQGYGKRQYDYGKQVESGEADDDRFFFACYEAPQDATDEQCGDIEIWKAANPSWGYIIRESEYRDAYSRARKSLNDFVTFKKYRLNIWQQSENPWLSKGDWEGCRQQYAEADLLGRECYAGLDLSKTRDTSALVLVFPEDDGEFKQLAYFWLPEETARAKNHIAPFMQWSHDGYLTLTSGKVIDYAFIRARLNDIRSKFDLRKIVFDATYAAPLMQRLTEEDGWPEEICEQFPQTTMAFAAPTSNYERLIIDAKLHHNGNPLFSWQAGNVCVKADANGNIRPVKQRKGTFQTIDGAVAAIMGLAAATVGVESEKSIYNEYGEMSCDNYDPEY